MNAYRPLRAGLFFYECLRLLLLVVFILIAPLEGASNAGGFFSFGSFVNGNFFPYVVYLSPNALFFLMVLFVWLRPEEYLNYLNLYLAGKVIAVVSFFAWEIFTVREFPGIGNIIRSMILFGGSLMMGLGDILSVWGVWILKNKFRQQKAVPEIGGV